MPVQAQLILKSNLCDSNKVIWLQITPRLIQSLSAMRDFLGKNENNSAKYRLTGYVCWMLFS